MLTLIIFAASLAAAFYQFIVQPLYLDRLSKIPGPKLYALTKWRLALEEWRGARTRTIDALHNQYGPVIRIGPNEIHCNSLAALRTIYGAGSGYGRTSFYRMFDAYGKQNLFTFYSNKAHGDRKKLVANAYSKSVILKGPTASLVREKVSQYMSLIEEGGTKPHEIFSSLHYYSIDSITHFLYGSKFGGTSALTGSTADRKLLQDILDPTRRRLSWFAVHLPALTKWLYTRTGSMERLVKPLLPMQKPATYSGIRKHALDAYWGFEKAATAEPSATLADPTIITQLWKSHERVKASGAGALDSLDIASECADHLLAGIDTTADSLMFLVWAVSRPQHEALQRRLIDELRSLPEDELEDGVPKLETLDTLPVLNAVIKETLRLYSPLPASEPRSLGVDRTVDGYDIPAGTTISMSPYSLHRNEEVFKDPLTFNPDRWLNSSLEEVAEMNRWFWAFSSGGRMCIGLHLAMAEMTALVAAVYREYTTSIAPGFENKTPAITSRFEMFYDVTVPEIAEHECMITFERH
ncbi:putative P450 monooxygenase [Zymoseptoria tritici IPO323]|uniref:P450 monooxygenase n=1 Tax=Zymoseptoria tritici (strain CBS 115943 / IPO323) TaxID=336722 RepID=F9XIV4_ZYMTI|nr:putative P450 monooxygenase [Zymoseptoria tritici IPO323]EGP84394.1 putative P450 monooxygenase [Zymoseptoria tritici IPO323]